MFQQTFRKVAMNQTQVFKRGEMSVVIMLILCALRSPKNDENIEKIRQKINEDRCFTIDEISKQIWVS